MYNETLFVGIGDTFLIYFAKSIFLLKVFLLNVVHVLIQIVLSIAIKVNKIGGKN